MISTSKVLSLALLLLAPAPLMGLSGQSRDDRDPGVRVREKLLRSRVLRHFTLGASAPIEWFREVRDQNGARFTFRQRYFSGGAAMEKAGEGSWDTVFLYPRWNPGENPKKVRGSWGRKFISETVKEGIIPWITMYNLAPSWPARYKPSPAKAAQANMRNVETMRSYWEQVKLLMQICGEFKPDPIVVHVEPDEWTHMLLSTRTGSGKKMSPLKVNVKVGSTGLPELEGLPDTLRGYADAWMRLRARYAPYNVFLACSPSAWDWRNSMSASSWVKYLRECGAVRWDLAVLEFGDRDLGGTPGPGKPPPYRESDVVTRFGSWERQLEWIRELHAGTGLWVVCWQISAGNTYFRTCNQSKGHFADGIAQALLEEYPRNPRIRLYAQNGCVGFVFNPGQRDQTHVYDRRKDGITNPDPIPGNLGNASRHADDDGGYLRLKAGAYYRKPFPLPSRR